MNCRGKVSLDSSKHWNYPASHSWEQSFGKGWLQPAPFWWVLWFTTTDLISKESAQWFLLPAPPSSLFSQAGHHLVCEPHGSGSRGTLTQWISPLQWMGFGTAGEMSPHIELTFKVPEKCMARNAIHCLFLQRRLKNSCLPISCDIHALGPVELYRASLERANRKGKAEWAVWKENFIS